MGFGKKIASGIQTLRDKHEAARLWRNDCIWDDVMVDSRTGQWLTSNASLRSGHVVVNTALAHPSAHQALRRSRLVDHWIDRLKDDAVRKLDINAQMFKRWALLEHKLFWKELARVLNQADSRAQDAMEHVDWTMALKVAGRVGNIEPFLCASRKQLAPYVQLVTTEKWMPHPRVGLWMAKQGLWSLDAMRASVSEENVPFGYVRTSLVGGADDEFVTPQYLQEWCVLFLRNYGLLDEQKIRLVGQVMLAYGDEAWTQHLQEVCKPHIQGMDLDIMSALCGAKRNGDTHTGHGLYRTLRAISGDTPRQIVVGREHFGWFDPKHAMEVLSTMENAHANLRMFASLNPPQNRVDLYYLACAAKTADLSVTTPGPIVDTLPLPGLN